MRTHIQQPILPETSTIGELILACQVYIVNFDVIDCLKKDFNKLINAVSFFEKHLLLPLPMGNYLRCCIVTDTIDLTDLKVNISDTGNAFYLLLVNEPILCSISCFPRISCFKIDIANQTVVSLSGNTFDANEPILNLSTATKNVPVDNVSLFKAFGNNCFIDYPTELYSSFTQPK